MKRLLLLLILVTLCLLCGCDKGTKTDIARFCNSYNKITRTSPIEKENVLLRNSEEILIVQDDIILRLKVNKDNAIHTAIVTGNRKSIDNLQKISETAFSVLASPLSEEIPVEFLEALETPDSSVQKIETERFCYLIHCTEETITVEQINCLLSSLPSQPTLLP